MSNINIREMTEKDIDQVLEIERLSFTTPWSRDAFESEIKKNLLSKYILAEKNEQVVGYAGMWLIVDEIHITNVAVHPNKRGEGIGDKLVSKISEICRDRDMRAITLEVRKTNDVAKSLYIKHGFKEVGIRPGYYSDTNEDAIIMWKELG
ncbi:ribosomal protein S18-alanine N-acetyltransferase [Sporosalibacterium faouarense]|uniref:ribosomal protein S18-alanine N-acetyltransferase n=1 Tax=Sporosalibacterium faouarense TaxID=516123 RepID=UPI00141CD1C1|nr:ribosomal protein S18-alanine N-acetyltransferase [Sporosalibacterium faouarense]MTI46772.1 ribosomal-protein-alanine N-acetyltransferase [Bacillota bacterium]